MSFSQSKIKYSPTDLTLFTQSPFASWMNRFATEYPDKAPECDADDELMTVLQTKGFQHEREQLEQFKTQGLSVTNIDSDTKSLKQQQVIQAMQDGVDVIVQAYLEDDHFFGYADFLVKVPGDSRFGDYHYEVWDTKLSSKAKPEFIIQL